MSLNIVPITANLRQLARVKYVFDILENIKTKGNLFSVNMIDCAFDY